MKNKILTTCMIMLMACVSYGQDTTALINKTWLTYASDTGLTFQQIIAICDSQFDIK